MDEKANELYGQMRQEVLDKLAELNTAICENMDAAQAETPYSYGHAGSMNYIASQLDDIVKFANRS